MPRPRARRRLTPGPPTSSSARSAATPVPEGTIGQVAVQHRCRHRDNQPATSAGKPATLSFTTDFGSGPQTIQLNLGTYGGTTGVTQYAGNPTACLA